jgi:hypothetical protein
VVIVIMRSSAGISTVTVPILRADGHAGIGQLADCRG